MIFQVPSTFKALTCGYFFLQEEPVAASRGVDASLAGLGGGRRSPVLSSARQEAETVGTALEWQRGR